MQPSLKRSIKPTAEDAPDRQEEKWGKKYPIVFESYRGKWDNLSNYFQYSKEIRRIIYTPIS